MSQTAFITGASSGIGAEFARRLAKQQYNLILHGRSRELLDELHKEIRSQFPVTVEIITAELADITEQQRLADIIAQRDDIHCLINNAGFGLNNYFADTPLDDIIAMLRVHNEATLRFIYAVLPQMKRRNAGVIINVSSVAGFLMSPRSGLYCATKAFLNTLTESLALDYKKTNIRFQALCPGFTITRFHQKLGYDLNNPKFQKFMSPSYVVDQSLRDLEKGKLISVPRWKYKLTVLLCRLLPRPLLYKIIYHHWRQGIFKDD